MTAPRLDIELPDGWRWVVLPPGADVDERFGPGAAELAGWLHEQGAAAGLLRAGDEAVPAAICGGVFLFDQLSVDGNALYVALEEDGEPVALGDLDGIPIISHVRRAPRDDAMPLPMLHISYLLCPPGICVVITFVAPDCDDRRSVVNEVAKIVSAARVVHSDGGCPV